MRHLWAWVLKMLTGPRAFPGDLRDSLPAPTGLGQKDPLEKEIATHPNILAWEIPWTEEPGGLESLVFQRVGHDLATK